MLAGFALFIRNDLEGMTETSMWEPRGTTFSRALCNEDSTKSYLATDGSCGVWQRIRRTSFLPLLVTIKTSLCGDVTSSFGHHRFEIPEEVFKPKFNSIFLAAAGRIWMHIALLPSVWQRVGCWQQRRSFDCGQCRNRFNNADFARVRFTFELSRIQSNWRYGRYWIAKW